MRTAALLLLLLTACAVPKSSPLVEAVRSGDEAAVRVLAARGADPNAPSGNNGWTPLLHAVHKNQLATVAALVGAGADVNRPSPSGMTPLMMAAGYDNPAMTALLLAHGASALAADASGDRAIDHAVIGVPDIDRFTLFSCNDASVALLQRVSAAPQSKSLRWARIKGCEVKATSRRTSL